MITTTRLVVTWSEAKARISSASMWLESAFSLRSRLIRSSATSPWRETSMVPVVSSPAVPDSLMRAMLPGHTRPGQQWTKRSTPGPPLQLLCPPPPLR